MMAAIGAPLGSLACVIVIVDQGAFAIGSIFVVFLSHAILLAPLAPLEYAVEAVFVDSGRPSIDAIRANLKTTGLVGDVLPMSAERAIKQLAAAGRSFDRVFIDPPYDATDLALAAVAPALVARRWLAESAVLVCEYDRAGGHRPPAWPAGLMVESTRHYGQTAVEFLRFSRNPEGSNRDAEA